MASNFLSKAALSSFNFLEYSNSLLAPEAETESCKELDRCQPDVRVLLLSNIATHRIKSAKRNPGSRIFIPIKKASEYMALTNNTIFRTGKE